MVTKAELVAISKRERIPLGIVEKDFILTYVLKKIYNSKFRDSIVFKGGTALHKLYLFRRFSIDLDFTELKRINIDEFKKIIEDREIKSKIKDINKIGKSTRIILGYVSALQFTNRIFLDISQREQPVVPPVKKRLYSPFFESFEVLTFQLEELLAEKIRALMQRKKPRDYIDIYYIAESGEADIRKAVEITRKKLSSFKEDFDLIKIDEDNDIIKSLWEQDLKEILPTVPDFNEVLKKIKDTFIQ